MRQAHVFTLNYRLKNAHGEVVDTSEGGEPMSFVTGAGNVIPGIEKAVEGRGPGDCLEVTIPPAMAYGEYDHDLVKRVPKTAFEGVEQLKVGMTFQTNTGTEAQVVKVIAIDGKLVMVDANHPLAGLTLYFELDILGVRPATEKEIEQGWPDLANL